MDFVKIAIEEAAKSTHPQSRVGAVIYDKKKVLSRGHNYAHKSVRSVTRAFLKYPHSIHAEVAAILSARRDLKGADILVVRLDAHGNLRMAMPCHPCQNYLQFVGIRHVTYSSNEQGFGEFIL